MAKERMLVGQYSALYYAAAETAAVTSMTEVDIAQDVTISMSASEATQRTRESLYPRRKIVGLDLQLTFNLAQRPENTVYEAIRDAYLAGTPLAFAALSEVKTQDGAEGPLADFVITQFEQNQPLEDGLATAVTCMIDGAVTDYVEISIS